jgi:AcrR family transcriptional regulator
MSGAPGVVDGRTARAVRTRAAVVDALLGLINEGDLRPTAPRIAERAGVSLRSVFQHFSDLEALFAAAAQRQSELLGELVVRLPTEGPLADRIEAFVDQRARVLEAIAGVQRASQLQEPFSAELRRGRAIMLDRGRAEVERVFGAELEARPPGARKDLLDALDAVTTWTYWEHLRERRSVPEKRARRILAQTLTALLAPAG